MCLAFSSPFVTFHNSFPEMIIKIVKVFTLESLDFFFDVWYNMIEVKIGLTARFFGQLGEESGTLWAWVFTKRKFCPRQSVGADNT